MTNHAQRLAALRTELAAADFDGFVVPLTDEHMSEYVGSYAKRLEWLTGFKGSAGAAVVLVDRAAVFVDGRYTLQVRDQVDPALYDYVATPAQSTTTWLAAHVRPGARIGYDAWLHTRGWVAATAAALCEKGAELVAVMTNPVDAIWSDRPAMSPAPVAAYDPALAGRSAADKRAAIADALSAVGIDATVMTALDALAWAFNLRGSDVSHTPVGLAFAVLHADATADLFIAPEKLPAAVAATLGNGVRVHGRDAFVGYLASLVGKRVAADPDRAVAAIFDALDAGGATVVPLRDPAVLEKAVKNPVEQVGQRAAQARDAAAVARFLCWIATEGPKGTMTEVTAADRLEAFRREGGRLRDLSFDTISGSGPNGAIVHYKADPATARTIAPGSVYLVDSGGQYADGTTDITRTLWIGPGSPPAEVRDRFTRVLKGHIALATAVFPEGTSGGQLDILARQYLWAAGCDYAHGTGHGVGAYLAVHEGPQRIAKPGGGQPGTDEPLRAGMIVSNEPGYYKAGAYGIRIENLVLVEDRALAGGDAAMLGFETLTLAPIARDMIAVELLRADEIAWLDAYHARVLAIVGPQVDGAIRAWLEAACAPL